MVKQLFLIFALCSAGFGFSIYHQNYSVDEDRFIIHKVDPSLGKLKMYWKNTDGEIYGSLQSLKSELDSLKSPLAFAVNGGMYMKNQSPQGLYIQDGKTLNKVNTTKEAYGNFYLQPNGIFYITKNKKAEVVKTEDFKNDGNINYATQSGPMLLINGEYHKKLKKGSSNLHIRNAVGILPNGDVLFVMSKKKVNFYDLATLFKQKGCKNALYLDGFVSRTYSPSHNWKQLDGNFGVLIAETK